MHAGEEQSITSVGGKMRLFKLDLKYVIDARMLELKGLQAGGCPKRNSSSLRSEKMGASRLDLGGPSISMAPST